MSRTHAGAAAALCLLLAAPPASALSLEVGLDFTGSRLGVDSTNFPPDTMGAVGPDHVVELLNGRYAVYRKSDGVRVQTSTLNQFWTGAGRTPTGSSFDPRVLYDPASQRWFAASVDNARGANNFLVAVSKTSDPTAGWTAFQIDTDSTNANWADFPTLGLTADAVTLSAAMFPVGSSTLPAAQDVLVLPKSGLLAATPSVAQRTLFENAQAGFQAQPVVDLDGGGLPQKLYSGSLSPLGLVFVSTIGGPVTAPTLSPAVTTAVPGLFAPPTADQPGAKANLDAGDSRFASSVVLQNGSLWAVHTVDLNGRAAVRWLRFDPATDVLLESGVVSDPSLAFFYPSIAVNEAGEIVIGMSGSSDAQFASAYAVVGEHAGGATRFETPILLEAGVADYQRLGGDGRNRWGDYSATVVDPSDPHAFWTFQEYASAADTWAVRITRLLVVPEPASLLLVALGLAGLAARPTPGSGGRAASRS